MDKNQTIGQRIADTCTGFLGSWSFIIAQTVILLVWTLINVAGLTHFDPYPFILLNLGLSAAAAYTGPLVLMAGNRQSEIDREEARKDLEIDLKSERLIEELHAKVDALAAKLDSRS